MAALVTILIDGLTTGRTQDLETHLVFGYLEELADAPCDLFRLLGELSRRTDDQDLGGLNLGIDVERSADCKGASLARA
jgi:hypothetical protein